MRCTLVSHSTAQAQHACGDHPPSQNGYVMKQTQWLFSLLVLLLPVTTFAQATTEIQLGPYLYETKPDHPAFEGFHPRKAPQPGPLLLEKGDRLAICGDSITEQKMYSNIIETYLTACVPQLEITVRQYGWSGEKTDGFLRRMKKDCLTFNPTVATLCYGMNDSRYRPFDVTNGQWYEDHYRAIVREFKANDVKVVLGSPGCAGKLAHWVKSRSGSLMHHNITLCALRDIAIGVAQEENVRFADVFWPMYQAHVFAPQQHHATEQKPYHVAGNDGVHPDWAGQVVMAYAFLRSMGLDGDIGTIEVDLSNSKATASEGHTVDSLTDGELQLTSTRYPFCATGDQHSHKTIRSGMTLIPFDEQLNRLTLVVKNGAAEKYQLTWGSETKSFRAEQLAKGINLAAEFHNNPFKDAFDHVFQTCREKQNYETEQVKRKFHSPEGRDNFESVVKQTESVRQPLADAIANSVKPVTHTLKIESINE